MGFTKAVCMGALITWAVCDHSCRSCSPVLVHYQLMCIWGFC